MSDSFPRRGTTGLPDPHENPTLSVDEVAEILGWGRSAVYQAVKRGELPALRLGSRIRIPTAKLLELLGIVDEKRVGQPAIAEPLGVLDLVPSDANLGPGH